MNRALVASLVRFGRSGEAVPCQRQAWQAGYRRLMAEEAQSSFDKYNPEGSKGTKS